MNRKNTALFVGLLALLTGSMAFAQCPYGSEQGGSRHGRKGHMMGPRMMEKLNLSDAQKNEIEGIRLDMKTEMEPLRLKLKDFRSQMHELWSADVPDESAILAVQKKMHAVRGKLGELRIQMKLDMMAVLTPEQKSEFRELRGQSKGKRGRHGRGRGGDCPYAEKLK